MTDSVHDIGATPLDRDEAQGLLLTHITTRTELDRWEQDNILEALQWLDKTKPTGIFNETFVKELHRRMFANVWRWAGSFRKSDKNIGDVWQHISMDLKIMLDDTQYAIDLQKEPLDHIAVRFHHRLVWIHPFPNGNGRHARLMTDIVLDNVMHRPRFSWGGNSPAPHKEVRQQYIAALRAADGHDYQPLQDFVRT